MDEVLWLRFVPLLVVAAFGPPLEGSFSFFCAMPFMRLLESSGDVLKCKERPLEMIDKGWLKSIDFFFAGVVAFVVLCPEAVVAVEVGGDVIFIGAELAEMVAMVSFLSFSDFNGLSFVDVNFFCLDADVAVIVVAMAAALGVLPLPVEDDNDFAGAVPTVLCCLLGLTFDFFDDADFP